MLLSGGAATLLRQARLLEPTLRAQWFAALRLKSTGGNPKLTTSYVYEPCEFTLSEGTFGAHINSTAAQWGNRTGWVFMNESLEVTFAEYKKDVDQVCRGLLSAGFEKGDSMAIWSPNTYNWVVLYGAMAKAGIVSACVHPAYTAAEFERCLVKVGCKGIYIPESFKTLKYYQTLCNLIPELKDSKPGQINSKKYPFLKCVIVDSDKALPGCVTSKEIFQGGNSNLEEAEKKVGMDDPLTIVFTSGTTGHPKAAMLSHHGFVNNTMVYYYRNPVDTFPVNKLRIDQLQKSPKATREGVSMLPQHPPHDIEESERERQIALRS